jgi:hypothetical protein
MFNIQNSQFRISLISTVVFYGNKTNKLHMDGRDERLTFVRKPKAKKTNLEHLDVDI